MLQKNKNCKICLTIVVITLKYRTKIFLNIKLSKLKQQLHKNCDFIGPLHLTSYQIEERREFGGKKGNLVKESSNTLRMLEWEENIRVLYRHIYICTKPSNICIKTKTISSILYQFIKGLYFWPFS